MTVLKVCENDIQKDCDKYGNRSGRHIWKMIFNKNRIKFFQDKEDSYYTDEKNKLVWGG